MWSCLVFCDWDPSGQLGPRFRDPEATSWISGLLWGSNLQSFELTIYSSTWNSRIWSSPSFQQTPSSSLAMLRPTRRECRSSENYLTRFYSTPSSTRKRCRCSLWRCSICFSSQRLSHWLKRLRSPLVEGLKPTMVVKEIVSFRLPSKATSSCTLSPLITAQRTLTRSDSRTLWMLKGLLIWLI